MGRPTDNPKSHQMTVKLDNKCKEIIDMYQTLMNLYHGNLDFQKRTFEQLLLEQYHSKEYDKIKNHLNKLLDGDGKKLLGPVPTIIKCRIGY